MHDHSKLDSFGKDRAKSYDQGNSHLAPILNNLLYLTKIVLSDLPSNSKILCVGAGTGSEIVALAEDFPAFTFVAVEPSESMLEVCRDKLRKMNLIGRCELIHGYIEDVPGVGNFDASLCLLVLHHVPLEGRINIFQGISKRLKMSGYFICAEVSYDFASSTFADIIEKWKSLIRKSGSPEEKVQSLPKMMKEHLFIQAPPEVEHLLATNGFEEPIQFFQSLLIRAWYSKKKSS